MTTGKIIFILFSVFMFVAIYCLSLIWFIWPISELSLDRSGLFGDSFGVLTSLFSGLAFAGLIITMLLQKEELGLQRKELEETRGEFKKGNKIQTMNARLNALSTLMSEYNSQIAIVNDYVSNNEYTPKGWIESRDEQTEKKNKIMLELEKLVESQY